MDRTELKKSLEAFKAKCTQKNMPLIDLCVEEAYPGDISTSYIIQVKAQWVDGMDCSTALDFLFDMLWETTNEAVRQKIFSIQVLNSKEQLHCWQDIEVLTPQVSFTA